MLTSKYIIFLSFYGATQFSKFLVQNKLEYKEFRKDFTHKN